jgi:hypothetical protein
MHVNYSEDRKSENSLKVLSKILCEWDPLDVIEPGEESNEYDNYIPEIMLQLDKNITDEDLAKLLQNIADRYMQVFTLTEINLNISRKLKKHWENYLLR